MAESPLDHEQLDNLKRWWRSYGRAGAIVAVLALGTWLGWRQWQEQREDSAAAASLVYLQLLEIAGQGSAEPSAEQRAKLGELATRLKNQYDDTIYADFGQLMLARLAVADGKLDAAAAALEDVMNGSGDDELALLARLRLARVRIAAGHAGDALTLLDRPVTGAMAGNFAEVRGDAHLAQGDKPAARAAYQAALDGLGVDDTNRRLLLLKLNQVLPPAAAAEAEEKSG